ncbi:ABC transporter substrate-binding protein [Streptomyces prunicolor]|uniref:Extracellular solute-binding protein n=1 Tax=Streptomyces prunicolor TaxID=67348 RepID=A0ABU4F210_9ACTN|nr:extracellular solute-binding protein [Streptomyces prunicolor]MDV7214636.1 extracellular solute-binding protein [Streptomyces prunicolor]
MRSPTRGRRSRVLATAAGGLALLVLAACSGGSTAGSGNGTKSVDMAAELKKPATIEFWSWVDGIQSEVALFEKKYPNIKVKVVNAGQPAAEYPKLRTALKAGSGAPDVVQLEAHEVSSFTITKSLLDLAPYGADSVKSKFLPWAWSQVSQGSSVYAIPQDTGPMGMLYRKDIFDKYHIQVPTTWAEFATAAEKLHKADPKMYLTDMSPSNGASYTGLLWQAGSRPFKTNSATSFDVNIADAPAKKVSDYWSGLVKSGAVSTDPDFTDQWYRGLASGKYATWLTAAWGPLFLQGTAKGTSGKWRVAPLPQWSAGESASGNTGGSTSAVVKSTKYPAAAAAFAEFLNSDPASTKMLASKQSLFPATTALLNDQSFLSTSLPFFGGQKVNQVFSDISRTVSTDFTWSPVQDYVFSDFNDTVGKAITNKQDLTAALTQWQKSVTTYAKQQGFTVGGS